MAAVSLRYARAFAAVAAADHLDSGVALEQMRSFAYALGESRQLWEFLDDPSAPQEQRLGVIDALAQRLGMMAQVRNFIAVIVGHRRLADLNEIIRDYAADANAQAGISEAEITSARPLDAADREVLEVQIARLAGSTPNKIRATYHEDASLLGGAIIRIGSTVYDGSIRAQLEQLRQRLVAAQVA